MTTKSNAETSQEDVTTETTVTTPETDHDQETKIGEVIESPDDTSGQEDTTPDNDKSDEEMVPLHVVLDMKSEIKDLKKQLSEKSISKKDYDDEVNALQEKYDVDASFINDVLAVSEKRLEAKLASQNQQISDRERQAKVQETLNNLYENTIKANPEFAEVANKDIILELAKNPANRGKTMTQLLDEAYGRVVQKGTRTLESTQPGASRASESEIDFDNMDSETEAQVLADPEQAKALAEHNMKYIKNLM